MRFPRLSPFLAVPRTISPEIEKITAKPFFFLPWAVSSWRQRMQNAPLVEVAVVQANVALYSAETASFAPAVFCFTVGPGALDGRSAAALAAHLVAIRDGAAPDPTGGGIAAKLHDSSTSFYESLPAQLGPSAFWATSYVDPDRLPGGCLPADGVLPALVNPPEEYLELVPSSLWM